MLLFFFVSRKMKNINNINPKTYLLLAFPGANQQYRRFTPKNIQNNLRIRYNSIKNFPVSDLNTQECHNHTEILQAIEYKFVN